MSFKCTKYQLRKEKHSSIQISWCCESINILRAICPLVKALWILFHELLSSEQREWRSGSVFWPSSFCMLWWYFVFQSLSSVWFLVTPWTAAHQASLSFTISQSLLRLTSIESVMPSNHLILCCPLLLLPSVFPSIRVFTNESVFVSCGRSIGASASASVLPMNI